MGIGVLDAVANDCTVAILAGGESRRMGTDKSLLRVGGVPLLQRVIDRVRPLGLPVLLVTNTPDVHAPFGLPMVADVRPAHGSLGGLYTALVSATTTHVLALACDMPLLCSPLLAYLVSVARGAAAAAVVPRVDGRAHPMHAVYRTAASEIIARQLDARELRIGALYDLLRVQWIDAPALRAYDPALQSFENVNTPDELRQFEAHSPSP